MKSIPRKMPGKNKKTGPRFQVGIDSYSLQPLNLSAFEVLDWAEENGAEGVQFSAVNLPPRRVLDKKFFLDLSQYALERKLYLEWGGGEHIPFDPASGAPRDIFKINRQAAEQACLLGVKAIRSCSGGLMRWSDDSLPTEVLLEAMAKALRSQKAMLRDLGVTLAIETHFEFTTFELRRLFAMCEAEPADFLGICLDTMNLLTMLEDPVRATKRILPWVVMTHIKDGGILFSDQGLTSFPAGIGEGVINLGAILETLSTLGRAINLSLEDHGGDFPIPIFDLSFLRKFPDLTTAEFSELLALSRKTETLLKEGKIAVLERAAWPEHCESRVRRGILSLKEIVHRNEA